MSSEIEIKSNIFNSLLTQYKETYNDFLNTIGSKNLSFKTINNSAFIGSNNIKTIKDSNINKCLMSCSSNKSCSGATFDNRFNTCNLNSGIGNIINSQNQTAIIKQALFYSYQLKKINDKLTNINNSMINLAKSSVNNYKKTKKINDEKAYILQNNYKNLEQDRIEIAEIIREYETLNSAYENGTINVSSNYYYYIIYLIIAIFLIYLLMKYTISNDQIGGGNNKISPFIFILLSFIIVFNAILKN